jgi:hypothetical protein
MRNGMGKNKINSCPLDRIDEDQRQWADIFQVLKGKKVEPINLYSAKYPSKLKVEYNPREAKLRKLIATR